MTVNQSPPQPDDLNTWIDSAAHSGLTEREVTLWLDEWHVDDDTRIGLLERHSDIAATIEARTVQQNAWLDTLPQTDPGRCDRCRRTTGEQPRRTIDGHDLCTRCATRQHRPHDDRKEAA